MKKNRKVSPIPRFLKHLLCGGLLLVCGLTGTVMIAAEETEAAEEAAVGARQARQAPDWMQDGIIYQINLRAFTPEGTLRAAAEKLPHVQEAGATIVYLMPIVLSDPDMNQKFWSQRAITSGTNNPRNPYRTRDYTQIDSEYGTEADLKYFVQKAHSLGLRVLLDLVYYHCGPTAVIADPEKFPDFVRRDEKGDFVIGKWPFPLLNHENPALQEYLWQNMEYWVREFDVDGFRLDVSGMVPLAFWEEARRRLERIRPDLGMLSEGTKPEDQLFAHDVNYIRFETIDDVFLAGKPASDFVTFWKKYAAQRPQGFRNLRFFDNHDIANDDFENRAEVRCGFERANTALVLCATLDGVPFWYCGQEICDKNRHSIVGWFQLDWGAAEMPEGQFRMKLCRQLADLRKCHPSLSRAPLDWIENSTPAAVLSFRRGRLLVLINTTENRFQVRFRV